MLKPKYRKKQNNVIWIQIVSTCFKMLKQDFYTSSYKVERPLLIRNDKYGDCINKR